MSFAILVGSIVMGRVLSLLIAALERGSTDRVFNAEACDSLPAIAVFLADIDVALAPSRPPLDDRVASCVFPSSMIPRTAVIPIEIDQFGERVCPSFRRRRCMPPSSLNISLMFQSTQFFDIYAQFRLGINGVIDVNQIN